MLSTVIELTDLVTELLFSIAVGWTGVPKHWPAVAQLYKCGPIFILAVQAQPKMVSVGTQTERFEKQTSTPLPSPVHSDDESCSFMFSWMNMVMFYGSQRKKWEVTYLMRNHCRNLSLTSSKSYSFNFRLFVWLSSLCAEASWCLSLQFAQPVVRKPKERLRSRRELL